MKSTLIPLFILLLLGIILLGFLLSSLFNDINLPLQAQLNSQALNEKQEISDKKEETLSESEKQKIVEEVFGSYKGRIFGFAIK